MAINSHQIKIHFGYFYDIFSYPISIYAAYARSKGHIAELARLREAALKKGSFSSAVNAEANRGKAAGLYIDRKIIKTGKLEDMSEQELEAKMKQILDDYSQIIDVTPTSESSLPIDEESSSDPQK